MNSEFHPLAATKNPLRFNETAVVALSSRTLFYQLIQVSEYPTVLVPAYTFVEQQLKGVKPFQSVEYAENQLQEAFNYQAADCNGEANNTLLPLLAPILMTEGAWLNNIVQACTNQNAVAMDLFAVLLNLNRSLPARDILQIQLLRVGVTLPDVHTWAFAQLAEVPEGVFNFAALQLAIGQFPRDFFPEILGMSIAFCQASGALEQLLMVQADVPELGANRVEQRKQCLIKQLSLLYRIVKAYIKAFNTENNAVWQRIQAGYWIYFQQTNACYQILTATSPTSVQQALIALLQRILPAAIGHHRTIQLGHQSLDAWFSTSPFEGEAFLAQLRLSPYIDRENPANSRLLKLFEFKGPMFGVLNATEKALLTAWVYGQNNIPVARTAILNKQRLATTLQTGLQKLPKSHGSSPRNQREWFYTLVNIDHFPEALNAARKKVQRVLSWSNVLQRRPFKHYTHQCFDDFIQARYQQQVKHYQPLALPPRFSKQTYGWGIEQLAPAILTDGCWLQNCSQLNYYPTKAIGKILFDIYSDELGGGLLAQNHPFLYQQLMESIGLKLPPIHTRAFSEHAGFIPRAFDIPCYLMAISKFPSAFLPELLGLNMAIELSGLGKDYLRLAQALQFYGLDPTIVTVHISIDNVATGHAALARQAIQLYLDDIGACSGEQVMQAHWQRIYTGFCSLSVVSRLFTLSLVNQGLLNKLRLPLAVNAQTNLQA